MYNISPVSTLNITKKKQSVREMFLLFVDLLKQDPYLENFYC